MHHLEVSNVNTALPRAIDLLRATGRTGDSRNGAVLYSPGPVAIEYWRPWQRVLLNPVRDANPFFHLMEALWMLAGRNDLEFPLYFNSRFGAYSDDGKTLHGAYGHRWRTHFGHDQLVRVIGELSNDPDSRRAVLQMWDGRVDPLKAEAGGRDVPCNTVAYFDLRDGALNMTVSNRSNDLLWGALGANAVHFSVLQEFVAAALGAPIGRYVQFSNNLHIYTDIFDADKLDAMRDASHDPYASTARHFPLVGAATPWRVWLDDLDWFLARVGDDPTESVGDRLAALMHLDPFFSQVAAPVYIAWETRKRGLDDGRAAASYIEAADWQRACLEWIGRRSRKEG